MIFDDNTAIYPQYKLKDKKIERDKLTLSNQIMYNV